MPASLYDMINVKGMVRYRLNKQFIGEDKVPANVKAVLTTENIVDENGMEIVEQKTEKAKTATPEDEKDVESEDEQSTEDPGEKTPTEDKAAADAAAENEDDEDEESDEDDISDEEIQKATQEPSKAKAPAVSDDDEVDIDSDDEDEDDDDSDEDTRKSNATPPEVSTDPDDVDAATRKVQAAMAKKKAAKTAKRAPARVEKFKSKVPQSVPGMGFPRRDGKTVDIFDLKTPHTKLKLIGGHPVPLSEESYKTRTEQEIADRLRELGFDLIDYNAIEQEQMMADSNAGNGLLLEDDEQDEDISLG